MSEIDVREYDRNKPKKGGRIRVSKHKRKLDRMQDYFVDDLSIDQRKDIVEVLKERTSKGLAQDIKQSGKIQTPEDWTEGMGRGGDLPGIDTRLMDSRTTPRIDRTLLDNKRVNIAVDMRTKEDEGKGVKVKSFIKRVKL